MTRCNIIQVLAVLLCAGLPAAAVTQSSPSGVAAPAARNLQAIFLEVDGKVRWRADRNAAWRDAKVNDLLGEGAEVRTGLRSRAALRVGKNATVLVDAGTSFEVSQLEQDGETLRTLAAVKTGRVDFKVDKVGYSNDFKVATPQTTLSVRGTGFAVNSGSLNGVEVVGARTNMINAIELKYVTSNLRYFMSGASTSSSNSKDPVRNAWMSSLGPPQVAGTIADPSQLEQAAAQGQAGNAPTNPQQFQQIGAAESQRLPRPEGSVLTGLLRLQEGEFASLKEITDQIRDETDLPATQGSAREQIEGAHAQALARQGAIGGALQARSDMGEDRDALQTMSADSASSLLEMGQLREEMDAAIASDETSDQTVYDKLDRMAEIDDAWQGELKLQANALVASLGALREDLEAAASAAQTADDSFNALFADASDRLSIVAAASESLAAFQTAIEGYHQAVLAAIRSGEVGEDAMKKLLRSTEILQNAPERISAALAALEAATARLADAGAIVSQGDAITLAITALLEGRDISDLIPGLQASIDTNVDAIEGARFSAFFAAAAAGVAAIDNRSALAQTSRDEAESARLGADMVSEQAKLDREQTVALAQAMDNFWNTPGQEDEISPKARMTALLAQSQTDRTTMASLLLDLNSSIDISDSAGAALFLADMQTLDQLWRDPETGLLVEVGDIHDSMQSHLAGVQAAHDATAANRDNYEALLALADARRDSSADAAARMTSLRTRIEQYLTQYQALVEAGRGGEGAAEGLASTAAALGAVVASYDQGIAASQQAAAAAEEARSYGQRIMFSAASVALANAAALALESSGLHDQIVNQVDQMHQDLVTGQTNFDNAFGGQGGGGQGGGGG